MKSEVNAFLSRAENSLFKSILKGDESGVQNFSKDESQRIVDDKGWNVFHYCRKVQNARILKILSGHKHLAPLVRQPNAEGEHPIHRAAKSNNLVAVRTLHKIGASVTSRDKMGDSLLHIAVYNKNEEMVEYLCPHIGVDSRNLEESVCPLHIATKYGQGNIVRTLLQAGADVNVPDKLEDSPLHYAASFGHLDICRLLIDKGAKIDSVNDVGNSPLHCAVDRCHAAIVDLLLKNSSEVTLRNNKGESAFDMAERKRTQLVPLGSDRSSLSKEKGEVYDKYSNIMQILQKKEKSKKEIIRNKLKLAKKSEHKDKTAFQTFFTPFRRIKSCFE